MKTTLRRWLLTRQLRRLTRELDDVFAVRRETVQRESQLRRHVEAVSSELMRMDLRRHA